MTQEHIHGPNCNHGSPAELQILQAQAQTIAEQLERADSSLLEIEYLKNSLDEFKHIKEGNEILAPISSGIFVKAKLEKNDVLLVNTGNNVVVEKTVQETKQLLAEKEVEITEVREELLQQMKKLEDRLIEIGAQ